MRQPIVAGNWKMNKTSEEAKALVSELVPLVKDAKAEVLICPPFTALSVVAEKVKGTNIALGAQDVHWEDEGAFTGEISASMLKSVGCRYVVIGHSERRQYFCETNETVNNKVKAALDAGLIPIMCVGETEEQHESAETNTVVGTQLSEGLADVENVQHVVIAYEPIWAIGTGKTATPEQAEEVHAYIRKVLAEIYDQELARFVRILYGGSVKPDNAEELFKQKNIDGGLIGGASLEADSFAEIVKAL